MLLIPPRNYPPTKRAVDAAFPLATAEVDDDAPPSPALPDVPDPMTSPITRLELQHVYANLATGSASDSAGVSFELFIYLINIVFRSDSTPQSFLHSRITMIAKKGQSVDPKDYRPIAVGPPKPLGLSHATRLCSYRLPVLDFSRPACQTSVLLSSLALVRAVWTLTDSLR